jgi:hypothetical protein
MFAKLMKIFGLSKLFLSKCNNTFKTKDQLIIFDIAIDWRLSESIILIQF